jgi:DNA mismatch endonuclease (patch repair protein)
MTVGAKSKGAKEFRLHRGDIMSPETRSRVMARIRGRDTKVELAIAALLQAEGLAFESQARDLPGRPDFVLREQRVAVFCDGDFWHGWRFPAWRLKLSEKWEAKIAATRRRDARNHRALRSNGWIVLRLWEHQIENKLDACRVRIHQACTARAPAGGKIHHGNGIFLSLASRPGNLAHKARRER